MSKFKVGDKVIYNGVHDEIDEIVYVGGKFVGYELITNKTWTVREKYLQPYKTAQERLFDLGFEKVAKHKYVKVNKGGSGYDTPYKITIEFAFNMYQVKCECENWIGVDIELAEVLVDYLKELEK